MNEVFIFAKFDTKPSQNEIQQIKQEISLFCVGLSSDIELQVKTGNGSWWIAVTGCGVAITGWLIKQFASYLFKSFLDTFCKKLKQQNKLLKSKEEKSVTSSNDIEEKNYLKQPSFKDISTIDLIQQLDSKTIVLKEFVMSEWSESENQGKCFSIEKTTEGFVGRQHTTDSKEDFNSYLSKLIDRK